jgi:hypothetical protein
MPWLCSVEGGRGGGLCRALRPLLEALGGDGEGDYGCVRRRSAVTRPLLRTGGGPKVVTWCCIPKRASVVGKDHRRRASGGDDSDSDRPFALIVTDASASSQGSNGAVA